MENQTQGPTWKCFACVTFVALTLRALMNHYYSVHSSNPNFFVRCGVDDCPATFTRYHSFYKHVVRKHNEKYEKRLEEILDPPSEPPEDMDEDVNDQIHDNGSDQDIPESISYGIDSDSDSAESFIQEAEEEVEVITTISVNSSERFMAITHPEETHCRRRVKGSILLWLMPRCQKHF